ncbi:unnamed protein product [Camellia sinensis]
MKYGEISHFSNPKHKPYFDRTDFPFKCDGCKEVGIGPHYKCTACDYDLHTQCHHALLSSPSLSHPFYTKCSFQFLQRPPGSIPRYCNACEKNVGGFVYHCTACGFDLHPCCAKLPMVLDDGEVKLYLYRKVSASCLRCGRKGRSWSYRSGCKKYNFHVACVKEMVMENWQEICSGQGGGGEGNNRSAILETTGNPTRKLDSGIPNLKSTIQIHQQKSKGKGNKYCGMAGLALQFVVSAILGDPTTLIAGVVGYLLSK